MHAVLLRPLPYDRADRLVTLRSSVVAMGWSPYATASLVLLLVAAAASALPARRASRQDPLEALRAD